MTGAWRVSYIPTGQLLTHDREPVATRVYRHRASAWRRHRHLKTLRVAQLVMFYDTGWEWA